MSEKKEKIDSTISILKTGLAPKTTMRVRATSPKQVLGIGTPQVYSSTPFYTYTPPINVCGKMWQVPKVVSYEPEQLGIEFPPEPEPDPWRDLRCSSHMRPYLTATSLETKLGLAERVLRICADKFDTIAFRGMSGAFLGPPLAMRLHKNMVMVRKVTDDSHSMMLLEGSKLCNRYVVVDDFVSTKATLNKIIDAVYDVIGPDATCIGMIEVEYLDEEGVRSREEGKVHTLSYTDYIAERFADSRWKQMHPDKGEA